jgi:hypothetical protein
MRPPSIAGSAIERNGQNVQSLHGEIQLMCVELLRNLTLLQSQMQNGDANIATVASLISALQ